jgi:hypothetical protein
MAQAPKRVTYSWRRAMDKKKRKPSEGVPALQNDDVTGMTEDKQDEVIKKSGLAERKDAAEEFYEEQGEQARTTPAPRRNPQR